MDFKIIFKRKLINIIALLIAINIVFCLISFRLFSSTNYIKSIYAVISVNCTEQTCIEIRNTPTKIVLSSPENFQETFEQYLEDNGYTYLEDERLGSIHVILKNNKKEYVHCSTNRYYSKWIWE